MFSSIGFAPAELRIHTENVLSSQNMQQNHHAHPPSQGWITAADETSATRVSASDGFDLTACVAPKPLPSSQQPRPRTAAPAAEMKNPYRGLIKEENITWVRALWRVIIIMPCVAALLARRVLTSQLFPPRTRAPRPKSSSGCTVSLHELQAVSRDFRLCHFTTHCATTPTTRACTRDIT